ncbi:uncharacterized protein LAJ45_02993 [Morchella importuna]|uniref:uncharacterized protein n=1 Tax=Morchella importuna TaxID=1174673 RepID=UPI001E8E7B3B|nr:uncharacterized protein LAJ45_02993 [Morchella importuna]KAH8152768.1 hypothetical protein LAJ45_02993 [Morchella importuna]
MTEVAKPVDFLAHATAFLYDCSARARAAGVTTATPTERFVFHTAEGVQLQAYLRQGMMLPATKEAYETKYPRKDVETFLNELDKKFNLYQAAQDNALSIFKHTTDFHNNTFNEMFTLTGKIRNFAEEAKDKCEYLREQFVIITADGSKVTDPAVKEAIGTSQAIAQILGGKAKAAGEECAVMHKALLKFKNDTEIDRNNVMDCNKKFTAVLPGINARLEKLKKDIKDLKDKTQGLEDEYHHQVVIAATTPSYAWLGPIGLIAAITVASIHGPKAVAAKDAWDSNLASIISEEGKEGNLIKIKDAINMQDDSMKGVRETIDAALAATEKMRGAFSLMQGDFDGIYTKLTDFETNIGKTELFYRKIGGRDLKQAEGKWAEIMEQTKIFQTSGKAEFKTM